jgi:hypothetical protein
VELLEGFVTDIDHVAGFVPVVLNVFGKRLGNGQVLLLVLGSKEGCGKVVVTMILRRGLVLSASARSLVTLVLELLRLCFSSQCTPPKSASGR